MRWVCTVSLKSERPAVFQFHPPVIRRVLADMHFAHFPRLLKETLGFLLLWVCLDSAQTRGCSSFFCREGRRVSALSGVDPGSPLFLTPYIEKGAIDEGRRTDTARWWLLIVAVAVDYVLTFFLPPARKLSLVGELPGANVKSYAGYLTVNSKYNSNLFFWFFPALKVCARLFSRFTLHFGRGRAERNLQIGPWLSLCDKKCRADLTGPCSVLQEEWIRLVALKQKQIWDVVTVLPLYHTLNIFAESFSWH